MNTSFLSSFINPITKNFIALTIGVYITALCLVTQNFFIIPCAYIVIGLIIIKKNFHRYIPLLSISFFLSLLLTLRIHQQHIQFLSYQNFLKKPVTIHGIITHINNQDLNSQQTTLTIKTFSLEKDNHDHLEKSLYLYIFIPSRFTKNLEEDQEVKIYNLFLEQPILQSDFANYMIKEHLWATARCSNNQQISIIKHHASIKNNYIKNLYSKLPTTLTCLFDPLFLGNKQKDKRALWIQHKSYYWGTSHLMARSGIHLAVIFALLMFLFHYLQLSYRYRYFIILFLITSYCYISFPTISFLRSFFMIFVSIVCSISHRITNSLHTLNIVTMATILHNPFQILFLDFQLSFGITYIIIWLFIFKKKNNY